MPSRFFDGDDAGWAQPLASTAQRVALVVGVGNYRSSRLPNPPNDAHLVAGALKGLGFDTEILVDPGKQMLEHAMVRFGDRLEKAGPNAVGFFYFAGHGIQYQGSNYLVPVDAQIPETRYLKSGAIRVEFLVEEIARSPPRATVLVLDTCRDSAIRESGGGLTQSLAAIKNLPDGTIVVFSTATGDVADDGRGGNGPYALALTHQIDIPNRRLDALFSAVAHEVTESTGGKQRPALLLQGAIPPVILKPSASAEPLLASDMAQAEARVEAGPARRVLTDDTAAVAVAADEKIKQSTSLPFGLGPLSHLRVPRALLLPTAGMVLVVAALAAALLFGPEAWRRLFSPIDPNDPATWPVNEASAVLWRTPDNHCQPGWTLVDVGAFYCFKAGRRLLPIWESGLQVHPHAAAMALLVKPKTGQPCDPQASFEGEDACLFIDIPSFLRRETLASARTPVTLEIGGAVVGRATLFVRGSSSCPMGLDEAPLKDFCIGGTHDLGALTATEHGRSLFEIAGDRPSSSRLTIFRKVTSCPKLTTILENDLYCIGATPPPEI